MASCRPVRAIATAICGVVVAATALVVPAALSAAPPVVLVQAGHLSPGEPGYLAQTGASGNPFGDESEFNRRVRDAMITQLKAAGVDARPLGARVDPLGVGGATFVSIHHDSPGGSAMVGHAIAGGNENYYHGEGTGTASATPYSDSGPHRKPATTVSAGVQRTSAATAKRVSTALGSIFTAANGAAGRFRGVIPPDSNRRMNHFYGFYRTTAQSRVIVEVGAAPDDNPFLRKTPLISKTLSGAIISDLRARKLL